MGLRVAGARFPRQDSAAPFSNWPRFPDMLPKSGDSFNKIFSIRHAQDPYGNTIPIPLLPLRFSLDGPGGFARACRSSGKRLALPDILSLQDRLGATDLLPRSG